MYNLDRIQRLADIPALQAEERPDGIATIFEGRETTFAEFERQSARVASGLVAAGCRPQSRVGYLGKNSDRFFELLFGAFRANVVVVSVNWRLAAPEIEYVLQDAGCDMLFVTAEYHEMAAGVLDNCPGVKQVIAMDGGHSSWPAFEDWQQAQPAVAPAVAIAADDDVVQLYTSGTTGHPKGVQLTNANYRALFEAAQAAQWGDFKGGSIALACMPVFHVAGTNMGILSLAQGTTCVITKEVNPQEILDYIPRYRINYVFFVPAVILALTQMPQARETSFSSVERLFYGASPITEGLLKTARDMFGCDFYQLYGLTETAAVGTCLLPEHHTADKLRSCGQPYPGADMRVVDDADRTLPSGEVGEIVIRHPAVMKGYWNQPDATAEAVRDSWFHTGDAGYFDDEGFLYIHDRVKDMIVSGGENIYPAEVENAIFGHDAVADVAVIGVPDEQWGEAVKAMVVLKPGAKADAGGIVAFARQRIAGYKLPKSVDFIAELPRNPSGKILRRELREPFWAGKTRKVN